MKKILSLFLVSFLLFSTNVEATSKPIGNITREEKIKECEKHGMTEEAYDYMEKISYAIAVYEDKDAKMSEKKAAGKIIMEAYEIGYNNPDDQDKSVFKDYIDEDEELAYLRAKALKKINSKKKWKKIFK